MLACADTYGSHGLKLVIPSIREDKEPSWKEDCTGWKFDLQLDGEQIEDVQLSCLAERIMTFRPSNKLWSTGGMAALHHSCHRV